jgi:hypothetical protein
MRPAREGAVRRGQARKVESAPSCEPGFIVAEAAGSRQFLPKHYLDPIPLQQIQLSHGTLTQNPGW